MTAQKPTANRDVIPRWRSVGKSVGAGEFQKLEEPKELEPRHLEELERAKDRWLAEPSAVAASEFVGAALVAGEPGLALEAAGQLVWSGDHALLHVLGSRALGRDVEPLQHPQRHDSSPSPSVHFSHGRREKIALQKARLAVDPRNAIAWSDLARWYTTLGQFDHARRALTIARALAPNSRYLLRVTSRFLLHVDEPDAAFRLLNSSARTDSDPWLMGALLSVASVGDIPMPGLKRARRIIEDDAFRPIERAELVSELGTLELRGGSDKKARRLFKVSLANPTDNSLAQVEWASHRMRALDVPLGKFNVPFAAEAHARSLAEAGKWSEALADAKDWLDDQPFDSEAAMLGSYVAAVGLERWEESASIARLGRRAQPSDLGLINNLAYALIEGGQLDEAGQLLARAEPSSAVGDDRIALLATRGLLDFRSGRADQGRALYLQAIEQARRAGDSRREAMALAMLLREELGLRDFSTVSDRVAALDNLKSKVHDAGTLECVRRAEKLASTFQLVRSDDRTGTQ